MSCSERDEGTFKHRRNQASDSQVMDSSDSISLPSEPPDIGNWFSSYVYESPVLDTKDDFGGCLFEESEFQKEGFGIEEIKSENEENLEKFRRPGNENDSGFYENIASSGFVERGGSIGGKNKGNQSVSKGNQWDKLEKDLTVMNNSPFRMIFGQSGTGKTSQKHDNSSVQEVERSSLDDEGCLGNLVKKVSSDETEFMPLHINKYSAKNDRRSPERLLCEENFVKESSEDMFHREKVDVVIAETNLDSVRVNGVRKSPRKKPDKENTGNKSPENGFISTRKNKSSRENDENSLQRPQQEKCETLRNVSVASSAGKKDDAIVKRKALSERINLQPTDALEIAGKWQCPQKSKPNLGPPLKQLRLEQWVHRV